MRIAIACFPGCDVINLKLTDLYNQAIFLPDQKLKSKILNFNFMVK